MSALSAEDPVLEFTLVEIPVRFGKLARALNNVSQHLTFVYTFDSVLLRPGHLTESMHLSIYKVSDVVATVGPFENSKATDLAFVQLASVDEASVVVPPLFEPFSIDMAPFKITADLDKAIIHLFDALAFNFVSVPHAFVLLSVGRLLIFSFAMELSVLELPVVD